MKKIPKVILGGTFDFLHKGHEFLLKKAFKLGKVTIGLTSNSFGEKLKKRKVNDFQERKKNLEKFIKEKFSKKAKILKIDDVFGPTLREDFDFIVVSPETFKGAQKINRERKKIGKKPIKIIKIDFVLGEDGKPISASRILRGEINREGRECIFCQIVKRKKKCLKIYEDKKFFAFLDKNPKNPGHTLVIPKKHFRWVWDIPYIGEFYKIVKKIANGIKKALETDWIISPVLGDEIWHAHIHLIPRFHGDNFRYIAPPTKKISKKEMKKIKEKIKKSI